METENVLKELSKPFHPSQVQWKPGATKGDRALALAYADFRAYMNRLDEVCGMNWSIEYKPWGDNRIIACLTINGVTRCSTGEMAAQDEKNEMGGTVAEAQAAKRACALFGLGRYLYNLPSGWADYDPAKKQFTAQAKAKLTGILTQHYRQASEGKTVDQVLAVATAPQTPHSPSVQATDTDSNGDVLFEREESSIPTDAELEVLGTWETPQVAQAWAVKVGACQNEFEAKQSFKKIVDTHGGRLTKENVAAVYLAYLRHQQNKLQQKEAA